MYYTRDNPVTTVITATAGSPEIKADSQQPRWLRFLMPSVGDLLFLVLFWMLTCGIWGPHLLRDADTGWHIRNGEHILATLSVPRTDDFSYSMRGQAWYAWEWLWDAIAAAMHRGMGLNGVVLFAALVIAVTFTLLYRLALRASESVPVAAILTLLAASAGSIHFLARPHAVSWLFAVIWLTLLDSHNHGKRERLYWLPVLMVPWANLHGGFLLGIALLVLFLLSNLWTRFTASCPKKRGDSNARAQHLAWVTCLCLAATFITPYGYQLHIHLYRYLSNRFLMDNITEFLSPDFHLLQTKLFALLLLISLVAVGTGGRRTNALHVLLVAFAGWSGLYAARNIPISGLVLVYVAAPLLAQSIHDAAERNDLSSGVRSVLARFTGFSRRMTDVEWQLGGHVLPLLLVAFTVLACLSGGRLLSRQVMDLHFDPARMPVAASEIIASRHISDHLFSPDDWGGYLIYRLYPGLRLFVDDRHDFYGERFLRDYMEIAHLRPRWAETLDRYGIRYVLTPADSPLATALKARSDWRLDHSDPVAVLFECVKQ